MGGFIYARMFNIEYRNPFVGCSWSPKDMLTFIKHYKDIDYLNAKFSLNTSQQYYPGRNTVDCNIDDIITIRYIHSHELDICRDNYFKRIKRFDVNELPIFILNYDSWRYSELYNQYSEYDGEYKHTDYYSYSVKFNLMPVNTIQILNYHYNKEYNYDEIQTGKTNYLLYVDNDLAGDLSENEHDFLNLKVLINKIYNENN